MQEADDGRRSAACGNCGTPLAGRFCHVCGQEDRDLSVSFWTLVADGFRDVFAYDSRLLRTLKLLIFRPGKLTTEFLGDRRARYVPPFRLFLFMSILMFLLVGLSGYSFIRTNEDTTAVWVRVGKMSVDSHYTTRQDSGDADSGDGAGRANPGPAVADAAAPGTAAPADPDPEGAGADPEPEPAWKSRLSGLAENPDVLNRIFSQRLAQSFFLLAPIFALLLKGFYRRQPRPYLHHLVFALHLHSLAFLLIATAVAVGIMLPGDASVSAVVPFWVLGYLVLALKRAYRQGWIKTAIKTVLLIVGYLPVLTATVIATVMLVALF